MSIASPIKMSRFWIRATTVGGASWTDLIKIFEGYKKEKLQINQHKS